MFSVKFSWNWPGGSGEEHFIILSMYFRYFVIISPWNGRVPYIESQSHKDALCQVLLKLVSVPSIYVRLFVNISSWKQAWPFTWRNLNVHHLRMLCAKFERNWPSGSGEEAFSVSSTYMVFFRNFFIKSHWKSAWFLKKL